ncbi:MAG: hypothetical protein IJD52_00955 [Alphaproteobacteria bacterium]|nr:hypothetical protein [Alphaproteobacteria bacterium]
MKKIFTISVLSLMCVNMAHAATPWWEQPTICRLNPTDCYAGMGAGFDTEMWDADDKCWGMKLICPQALKPTGTEPTAVSRSDISRNIGISSDYDTDLIGVDGDCFGRRKTTADGSLASVNGNYVNVWCNGILDDADEVLEYGEITYGAQPTCTQLAENGYVAVQNGRCYGKYYDSARYFIECSPELRLIVLNGADYNTPTNGAPTTMDAAEKLFEQMYMVSKEHKEKYFTSK